MARKPLVYIAGPYTHPDPVENTRKAIVVGEYIESYNCAVFIPHLSLMWQLVSPAPYEKWLERDNYILERCDALFRMEGNSTGATKEVAYAKELGIPVFYHQTLDDFAQWRNLWKPSHAGYWKAVAGERAVELFDAIDVDAAARVVVADDLKVGRQ